MSRRELDSTEQYLAEEYRAEQAARNRYCPDCRHSGGHASGCPGEDYDGEDDEVPTMPRAELIDLAGAGDTAALAVIDAAIACNGEWSLIEEASDEELADWYADAQKAEAIAARAIVSHDCPPIPTTAFDWSAVLPGYDGGDPIGRGPTREAAIADLVEKVTA